MHTCITYENILGLAISAQRTTYETVQVHTSVEKSVLPSICAYVYVSSYFASFYTTKKQKAKSISHFNKYKLFTSIISLLYSNAFIGSESKDILACSGIYSSQVTAGICLRLRLRQHHRRPQLYGNQPLRVHLLQVKTL